MNTLPNRVCCALAAMAFGLSAAFVFWKYPMESKLGPAIKTLRLNQMK
jgi:hypothetical protein